MAIRSIFFAVVLVGIAASGDRGGWAADTVSRPDVMAVLSDRCFACHGPDEASRRADLRLDVRTDALGAIGESADQSELISRVTSTDRELRMPPPAAGPPLTAQQITDLKAWIESGAPFERHWSFEAPRASEILENAVGDSRIDDGLDSIDTPTASALALASVIDDHTAAVLMDRGLVRQTRGDAQTIARRASVVATGLAMSPERIDLYLQQPADVRYANLVDGLLGDAGYGVQRARYWLDAVRYGDTHGMARDDERAIWMYRDWVVDAFNANLPLDEFATKQLAGDLLPDPQIPDLIATGYNRCNVSTAEGGSIEEELIVGYAADRTDTFGSVFLGLTIACARCHDHKFDPISQADYYRLLSFFNNIDEEPMNGNALDPSPVLTVPSHEQAVALEKIQTQISDLVAHRRDAIGESTRANQTSDRIELARRQFSEFCQRNSDVFKGDLSVHWHRCDPIEQPNNTAIAQDRDLGPEPAAGSAFDPNEQYAGGARWQAMDAGDGGPIRISDDNSASFFHAAIDSPLPVTVPLRIASDESLWKPVRYRVWIGATLIFDHRFRQHEVPFEGVIEVPLVRGRNDVMIEVVAFGGPVRGEFELRLTTIEQCQAMLQRVAAGQAPTIADWTWWVDHGEGLDGAADSDAAVAAPNTLVHRIAAARGRADAIEVAAPVTMITRERTRRRETFVLSRGRYDAPGQAVDRGVPESLSAGGLPAGGGARVDDRLALANWLFDPDHPLVARVMVNRIWQQCFGIGLVETAGDFGLQGARPSHPQLLDDLAIALIRSGWDQKLIFRAILNSDTFTASSQIDAGAQVADPNNRLLWRGPRFRMDAEVIRDTRLQAAGLLDGRLGGRGVKPPQPAGLWEPVSQPNSTTAKFFADGVDQHYRRSLYLFWKRTSPPPSMQTFDAPMRDACVVDRGRTNTPLQALALLNDQQYFDCAAHMADRAIDIAAKAGRPDNTISAAGDNTISTAGDNTISTAGDNAAALRWSFRWATGRTPDDDELGSLASLLADLQALYENDIPAAANLVAGPRLDDGTTGQRSESDDPATYDVQHAAWTVLCNTLLNLSESVSVP